MINLYDCTNENSKLLGSYGDWIEADTALAMFYHQNPHSFAFIRGWVDGNLQSSSVPSQEAMDIETQPFEELSQWVDEVIKSAESFRERYPV